MSRLEEKLAFKVLETKPLKHVFEGKRPIESYGWGAFGTYGGGLTSQAVYAAWATVKPGLAPHSLHQYFVKHGSEHSPITWEVQNVSSTKSYANRLVQGFQKNRTKLIITIQISFCRGNEFGPKLLAARETEAAGVLPLKFQSQAGYYLKKYGKQLDKLESIIHRRGLLEHIIPPEYHNEERKVDFSKAGDLQFGVFFRIRDDWKAGKDPIKAKVLALTFATDAIHLTHQVGALGLKVPLSMDDPLVSENLAYFRTTLDHNIYYHDLGFDPSQWMLFNFRFTQFGNDRLLCQSEIYDLNGVMIASVIQESIAHVSDEILKRVWKLQAGDLKVWDGVSKL